MLLLTGPPGSGKTRLVLDQLYDTVRRGSLTSRLLVPTATMADHLRNELARRLGALPDGLILTLSSFVAGFPTAHQAISPLRQHHLVRRLLEDAPPEGFRRIAAFRGFQNAIADLLDELSGAGVRSFQLDRLLAASQLSHHDALVATLAGIEDELLNSKRLTRADHLRAAAASAEDGLAGLDHILLDGFFSFTPAELELVRAFAEQADVTITLPRWSGSEWSREKLFQAGFEERILQSERPAPAYTVVRTQNMDAEATEVARRIVEEAARGRAFRDMGVIVRKQLPYAPVLEAALARFGIPARFYFGRPLAASPSIRRLVHIMESRRRDWDLEPLLAAIQLDEAGPERDRLDFALRERVPGLGMAALRSLDTSGRYGSLLGELEKLEHRHERAAPGVWAECLARLARSFPPPAVTDAVTHDHAGSWRLENAALRQFDRLLEELAEIHGPEASPSLDEFWDDCRHAIDEAKLFLRDHRRNVVHVIDAFEARQWSLPVVFVCGLVENEFPRRHAESPLLPDTARRDLRQKGVAVQTAAGQAREEEFLFDLALTRASERCILLYPAHDAAGNPNQQSFLLRARRDKLNTAGESATPVRPASDRRRSIVAPPRIWAEDLQAELATRHATLSPSAIELFLACPFHFFAEKTLKLREPPAAPHDRFDALLQGSIVHEVLKETDGLPLMLEAAFERVCHAKCAEARVPPGYQTERIRLEMLRSLERWSKMKPFPPARETLRERDFDAEFAGGLKIRGRLDRVDVHSRRRALVIDYKYSAAARLREYRQGSEDGERVQAGLYLLAVRDHLELRPVGMLYTTLRETPAWGGWCLKEVGSPIENVEFCVPEVLDELMETARTQALAAATRIRRGEIAPPPEAGKACPYCSQADICRRRELQETTTAGGGS